MKTLIFIAALFAATTTSAQVTRTESGNFVQTTKAKGAVTDSLTAFTYTDTKGATEPVYSASKGENKSYFVPRISGKTGKYYRRYLTVKKEE